MSMYLKIENPPEEVKFDLEEHYRDRERRVHDSIHRLIDATRKLPDELGKRRFTEGLISVLAWHSFADSDDIDALMSTSSDLFGLEGQDEDLDCEPMDWTESRLLLRRMAQSNKNSSSISVLCGKNG